MTANLVHRGRWVAFATLLWWLGPRLVPVRPPAEPCDDAQSRADAWGATGVAVIALPLTWVLATWLVMAVRLTLLAAWTAEGRAFVAPDYYRGLLLEYVPWLMAGSVVLGIKRHL